MPITANANAAEPLPAAGNTSLVRREKHTIEEKTFMNDLNQPKPKYSAFWDRMEENSEYVSKLPDWVKGSPVNERSPVGEVCVPAADLQAELEH
jgi:hypothetical protein